MSEPPDKLPRHVAVIMDGNGRWAQRRGLPRTEGHAAGAQSAKVIAEVCLDAKIPVLTFYTFSTENWKRPRAEVQFLMRTLRKFLRDRRAESLTRNVRLMAIGVVDELPKAVQRELRMTVEATRDCDAMTLVLALNYGSRREITDAVRAIALEVKEGRLDPGAVDEETVRRHLYTAGLPDPDLLIRTGGEMRVSNFLLWQLSYAELYVTETLWPDFGREEFAEALREFARRERRFGAVGGAGAGPAASGRGESRG
jgi:undecaprenyl diphosphate synthase